MNFGSGRCFTRSHCFRRCRRPFAPTPGFRLPDVVSRRKLLHRPAGKRGAIVLLPGDGLHVFASLDQQPLFLIAQTHEIPFTMELPAMQHEMKFATSQLLRWRFAERLISPLVPHHHRTAAIFPLGDGPLEINIGNRVVLNMHRQVLFPLGKRHPFRNRPRFQHSAQLQPEIVVQPRSIVFLNDKPLARLAPVAQRATGLCCFLEVPLSGVFLE